ncbi:MULTISPECIES: helix-turn-helix transcriptional regulator [Morganellaceae]|uniref:helix-turn-helix transcriptional regulator n=2 Tax=Morganellaceae TaxID=1903414 RepID=UPI00083839C3|nr:AlpA family phage regulatory protein [Providencia rettgeri]NBN05459.1 AlpA family phage regulatory protein [Proteus sp. G2665]NIH22121.1 AlpA family phage regulatory protein [Providencia heimbachae]ULK62910.1 AlpA family phage regulatory protein [Proteus mirabilis]ELR5126810.1 AlpA family phage regulatory protein [Providencia rettgeri]
MNIENKVIIITMDEVLKLMGLKSRNSIYSLEKTQQFPRRIRIGVRRVGYDLVSVEKWLESRTMK